MTEGRRQILPLTALRRSMENNVDSIAEAFSGRIKLGDHLVESPSLLAWKTRNSFRPITLISSLQEIALHAMSAEVAERIGDLGRGTTNYRSFVEAPSAYEDDALDYVLMTDVHSFYAHVAHDALERELVRGGVAFEVAREISTTLGAILGKPFGLPQISTAADILSEAYIDPVQHRLARRGYVCWRYNDDFRVRVRSFSKSRGALEELAEELLAIGLFINDAKTVALHVSKYRSWIESPLGGGHRPPAHDEHTEDVTREEEGEYSEKSFIWFDDIEGLAATEADAEEAEAFAVDTFGRWRELAGMEDEVAASPLVLNAIAHQVTDALGNLGRVRSITGLEEAQRLLSVEPHLTPHVAAYIAALGNTHAAESTEFLDARVSQIGVLPPWQQAWMIQPIVAGLAPGDRMTALLRSLCDSSVGYLSGRAYRALLRHNLVSVDEGLTVLDRLPEDASSDVYWGILEGDHLESLASVPAGSLTHLGFVEWLDREFAATHPF